MYCMRDTMCKWCHDKSQGKRKAHQEHEVANTSNKKARPSSGDTASKKTKRTYGKTAKANFDDNWSSSSASSLEASDTESERSESDSDLLMERKAASKHSPTELQRLKLLRLRVKVMKYEASARNLKVRAMEAHYTAERFAAQLKLERLVVPEREIEHDLPSLW
ncbi:unnamed protein product [Phytophthora lilii]|uniref:Unnamed protein product n=1 Tax=Phytophthora lilii TaxID=2077276 RepID=A0A9W6WXF0_9STRA|nr:unnamed protein product [Phytophthora lilii]